jgi:hypothetical protein
MTTLLRVPATARWLWPPEPYASLLLGVVWLVLASPYPPSLRSTGMVLILVVFVLNVVLGVGSGWLAFARASTLDQRQLAVRNRAYRLAFLLVGTGILVMIALSIAGGFAPYTVVNHSLSQLPEGLSTRRMVALLELVFIAPTAVIAWLVAAEPNLVTPPRGTLRGWAPALAIPVLAAVWFIAVAAMPARTVTVKDAPDGSFRWGATCGHFAAMKEIGYGFGGAVQLQTEVCWDGERTLVVGDDRSSCTVEDRDFALVSVDCIQWGNRLTLHGRVSPLPGGLGAREVDIQIEVGASGGVITLG